MILNVMWMMTALVVGFMVGRISMYGLWAEEDEERQSENEEPAGKRGRRGRTHRPEEGGQFWAVGSPAAGEVISQEDGERPVVVIHPDSDKVYAPANGKITRLFPMGNSFLFTTDFGAELYIQAGDVSDDLLARFYRPRVLQNEVVAKGKLLLEFDRKGLEDEGRYAEVSVRVAQAFCGGEIRLTAGGHVAAGEEILQMREPSGQAVATAG